MAQPKKPPVSIRIPDELVERVKAWADQEGVTRNAAYIALITRGLSGPVAAVESEPTPAARKAKAPPAQPTKAAAVKPAPAVSKPEPVSKFTPKPDTYPAWMRGKK
jgi:hypothetical protein